MALWENVIGHGLHADRPAAGSPGACYFESDTGNGFRDSGTAWDLIVSPAPPAVVPLTVQVINSENLPESGNVLLTQANVVLLLDGVGATVTLPDPAGNSGLLCYISSNYASPFVYDHDGSTPADRQGTEQGAWVSDGANWWRVV